MTFEKWLVDKSNLIWLQPDALLKELSQELSPQITLPDGQQGAVFIWDEGFFAEVGIGKNRQAFLWQALQSIAQNLAERFLLIQAPHKEALSVLLNQSLVLRTWRSPLTEPLFHMSQALLAVPVFQGTIVWQNTQNWIDYPQKLPNGFFKFWKHAEKQIFSSSEQRMAVGGKPPRAHKLGQE